MSCTYGTSDVFKLVPSDDVNSGIIPANAGITVGIFPIVGHRCLDVYAALMDRLGSDIRYARHLLDFGIEMPRFILLCHEWEKLNPNMVLPIYLSDAVVEVRDITMGLPLAANYYLYVTDPPAIGMSNELTLDNVRNSPLRNAGRVTYIQEIEE